MLLLRTLVFPVACFCLAVLPRPEPIGGRQYAGTDSLSPVPGLFDQDSVLNFRLSGDIRSLVNDRSEHSRYHPLLLSYANSEGSEVNIRLKAKTRGHFRRSRDNCNYPPLLLNFEKGKTGSTVFEHQDKLKLVCPCRGEEYVVREWLVYQLFNLLTPKSFKARLVRVGLYDTVKKKQTGFYGILVEDEEQMAKRNQAVLLRTPMMRGTQIDTGSFLRMAVFQYFIGNTDWSIEYFQNTRVMKRDSLLPEVVPFDFDHAGIVNAPYALPAAELGLRSVQERRYRGYCIAEMKRFDEVVSEFNRLKKDFYSLYVHCPFIDARYLAFAIRFMEDFYQTVNTPGKRQAAFAYPCTSGLPDIIIRGLRN